MALGKNMITYGLGFGALGLGFGAVRTWLDKKSGKFGSDSSTSSQDYKRYRHIPLDQSAKDAIDKLRTYQKHTPEELQVVMYNLDRLISLQIMVQQGNVQASFPYKAKRYESTLKNALRHMRQKLSSIATPHYDTDEHNILTVAEDYQHNICMDCDAYLMANRSM